MNDLQLLETVQTASRLSDEGALVNEREREILDIIGMAVKRKKAKHAGMDSTEGYEKPAYDSYWWVDMFFFHDWKRFTTCISWMDVFLLFGYGVFDTMYICDS